MADTGTAHYFHSSIYAFGEAARTEVINRFNRAINNGSAHCWYDAAQDQFCLECPNSIGATSANDQLAAIIKGYIREELDAAEREERDPAIERFFESTFIDLNDLTAEDVEDEAPSRPLQAQSHLIKAGDTQGRYVRLFHLYDLPDEMLERTLVDQSTRTNQIINERLTCRLVKWSVNEGYQFNGNTGASNAPVVTEYLQLPEFGILVDERKDIAVAPTRTWEHVGEPPSVAQWVQGTGRTRQIEPEERSDVPKDAQQYLASGTAAATTIGRLRLPKGQTVFEADDSEDFPQDDDRPKNVGGGFDALLAGAAANNADDDSGSETASSSSAPGGTMSFAALLNNGSNGSQAAPSPSRVSGAWNALNAISFTARRTPSPFAQPPRPTSAPRVPHDLRNASPVSIAGTRNRDTVAAADEFPDYGKRFAKVDSIGLAGNAAETAQYNSENYKPNNSNNTSMPVVPRGSSPPISQRNGNGNNPKQSKEKFSAQSKVLASQKKAHQDFREADWNNNPSPAPRTASASREARLVDDEASPSTRPVEVPPGLSRPVRPETDLWPLPGESAGNDSDERIIERKKTLPENFSNKQYTMRQKAGKKNKSGKGKGKGKNVMSKTTLKVDLPLPDPPPPPKEKSKPKPTQDLAASEQRPTQQETRTSQPPVQAVQQAVHPSSGPEPANRPIATQDPLIPAPASSIESTNNDFGRFLLKQKKALAMQDDDDDEYESGSQIKLIALIGILLTKPVDKEPPRKAPTPSAFQKQLNIVEPPLRPELFPRLTTSKNDAAYLLKLGGEDMKSLKAETIYEITVKDTSGTQLTIRVPTHDKMAYTVTSKDIPLAEAYAHYPMHVWDAWFTLIKSGKHGASSSSSPASDAIKEFVTSMETEEDQGTPSFKAIERNGVFKVSDVLAKRIFTSECEAGTLLLRVTQAQQLERELVDSIDGKHNFRAIASSEKEMIREHRLWWEACWETTELEKAGLLEAQVDSMVGGMNRVGWENVGPYQYREPSPEEEDAELEIDADGPVTGPW